MNIERMDFMELHTQLSEALRHLADLTPHATVDERMQLKQLVDTGKLYRNFCAERFRLRNTPVTGDDSTKLAVIREYLSSVKTISVA